MARTLIVVEDRHAEAGLRQALRQCGANTPTVLTADALLAMIVRRDRIDTRLVTDTMVGPIIDELDRAALSALDAAVGDGSAAYPVDPLSRSLGPCLHYSLIPTFIRSVRNVAVLHRVISASRFERVIVIGGGRLARAALLVAAHLDIRLERMAASPWQLLQQTVSRLRAGQHTRWVGTEFRALVLEPGFLLILYAKGWWHRCLGRRPTAISRDALIVTGDRWTADVVGRMATRARTVIVAGATQPGRALLRDDAQGSVVAIEQWSEPADLVRGVTAVTSALRSARALAEAPVVPERFRIDGISFWPLVAPSVRRHMIVWLPLLRYVEVLVQRVAHTSPAALLLTSADVTGYVGVLVMAAREKGIASTSIQHGLMGEPNGHSVVRADVLAAWGTATEQWHRARAPQRARFVVTGNSRFDTFPSPSSPRRRDPSRPFTVDVCTGFVSEFSVCASDALNLAVIEATLDWAATQNAATPGSVRVVHKLHPGEEPAYYAGAAAALGWQRDWFTMTNQPVLHDLLQSSDALVTGYSTTVIEAILLGTPVVVSDFEARRILPVDRIPGVAIASSPPELHHHLDAVRAGVAASPDPSHPELRQYISTIDGRAGERVAALVTPQDRSTSG